MTIRRSYGFASLLAAGALLLAGCQSAAQGDEASTANAPASVETAADGGPARLTVVDEAVQRLGITTAPVQQTATGGLAIPYAAVVYDADGGSWTFVEQEPGVYQREPIAIAAIDGDVVTVSSGPPPGTPVVTVGAAELVGVEAGISGGE